MCLTWKFKLPFRLIEKLRKIRYSVNNAMRHVVIIMLLLSAVNVYSQNTSTTTPSFIKIIKADTRNSIQIARDLYDKDDYSAALEAINNALKQYPDSATAYYVRVLINIELKDTNACITDLNKAISLDPTFAEAYNYRGFLVGARHNYKQAIEDFTRAIELKPDFIDSRSNLAFMKERQGNYAGAIEGFNDAIQVDSTQAHPYCGRAMVEEDMKNYAGAMADYNKAIDLDNYYAKAFLSRGKLEIKLSLIDTGFLDIHWAALLKSEEAIKYLDTIRQYEPLQLNISLEINDGQCGFKYTITNKTNDSVWFFDMSISNDVIDEDTNSIGVGFDVEVNDSSEEALFNSKHMYGYELNTYSCNKGKSVKGPLKLKAKDSLAHIVRILPHGIYTSKLKMYGISCNSDNNPKTEDAVSYKYYIRPEERKKVKFHIWYDPTALQSNILYGKKIWVGILDSPTFTENAAGK